MSAVPALPPTTPNAWVGLGAACTRLGRNTEALRALKKAVEVQPQNPFAQRNLGALLSKEGKHADALPHFRQAVAQAPNDLAAAFGLGQCLQGLGANTARKPTRCIPISSSAFPTAPERKWHANSALPIKTAAEQTQADFIFTVMEAWGLPRDKMPRFQEILDKHGSVGASPYKIDTASFVIETRYGVWGAQVPLKPRGYFKKKRTFGPVELQFMDGVEGRFVGVLLESEKQNLH